MATVRPEVLWTQGPDDTFLTWSTNIQFLQAYDIQPDDVISPPKIKLGDKTAANLLATNSDYQYIKCVACYNGPDEEAQAPIIAVGQANGRVAITSFNRSSDIKGIIGKEFVPKSPRAVNALAWNPLLHQYLAVGLDKATRDQSLIILDVCKSPVNYGYDTRNTNSNLKPIMEWSSGEIVHSVEFSKHNSRTLLAGVNYKQLKLFDLREEKIITTVTTKAVHGICSDPFDKDRFASHVENTVCIWDLRNIERPLITLAGSNDKSIHKLSWCPTRQGLLGCLSRESSSIRLYQLFKPPSTQSTRDDDIPVYSRSIVPERNAFVSSFSWHPSSESRIISTSYSGKTLDIVVHERIAIDWAVMNNIGYSRGKRNVELLDENNIIFERYPDISMLIKERALKKYGLFVDDLSKNGELTGDTRLQSLWTGLQEARKLAQNPTFMIKGQPYNFQGVLSLLSWDSLMSEVCLKNWEGDNIKSSPAKMFRSEERSLVLTLCMWGASDSETLDKFLHHLINKEQFTRAAAVSVFNLRLSSAIQILKDAAINTKKPFFHSTVMALAGFTNERKALWRETCILMLKEIEDPYLRALFAFLTGDSETFDPIVRDKRIEINDRVAFACKYLNDARLIEYITMLKDNLIEEANLDGFLLAGINLDGVRLLQQYVDQTSDVQTAALVSVHFLQALAKYPSVEHWVESYRNLLDSLQLWKYRAQMDVIMHRNRQVQKFPVQIYVSCNFCYKNTMSSYTKQSSARARMPFARFSTQDTSKLKITSCPKCKKPLPRCSLCLQHMGTPSKRANFASKHTESAKLPLQGSRLPETIPNKTLSKISGWFSWCQACCHGGHAQHMMQWFKEHSVCPVTSCSCKCINMDGFNWRNVKGY